MMFQKLLKLTIVDALDHVWSEAGVTPSKKTRQTIIRAAEMISKEMQQDFVRANKEGLLYNEKWDSLLPAPDRRPLHSAETQEVTEPLALI